MATVTLNRCPEDLVICITRGDTQPLAFDILETGGAAAVLTSKSFLLTVDTQPEPTDEVTQVFSSVGVVSGNTVTFPLSAANVLTAGDFYCDIQETDGSAELLTLGKGTFQIKQDIKK